MAFILSNNYDDSIGCEGQHLFKFDPKTFTVHPSSWTYKTIGSTDNCNHLGLAFGRDEFFLYAFSWYNSFSTVSLLHTTFNSIW